MAIELYHQYSLLLDRTARRVKQYAQRCFTEQQFNITVDQWLVLKTLNNHNDLNQSELAELTGKDQPTLTRIVDLLCKKGYAERRQHASDRRCFVVHLTPSGTAIVTQWAPRVNQIRMKAWENLTGQDYETLKRILNTIYNNLEMNE